MAENKLQHKLEILLQKFEFKKTPLRIAILEILYKAVSPLSQAELLLKLTDFKINVDRVSVYRNLNQLKSVGLIHEVDLNSYVLCSHDCEEHAHLLLFCQKCHKHQEIKDHAIIKKFLTELEGFHFLSSQTALYIKGVCKSCELKLK